MAALAPLATVATLAVTGVQVAQTLAAGRQRETERENRIAVIDTDTAYQEASAQADTDQLNQAQAIEDRRRRDALRRSVARRRASLGGQNVGSGEGSGEALLLGLVNDSALEGSEERSLTDARISEVGRDLDYRRRLNLLERSNQESRKTLDRLTTIRDLL